MKHERYFIINFKSLRILVCAEVPVTTAVTAGRIDALCQLVHNG
jgi:hypothetical protein